MQHQDFWVNYLESTHTNSSEWIYWLAYDDQVFAPGMRQLFARNAESYKLQSDTVYFGPWAMRHEAPDELWNGSTNKSDKTAGTSTHRVSRVRVSLSSRSINQAAVSDNI